MKIIFIRHGKTNFSTGKLSCEGVFQAHAIKRYLKNEKIDAIYCSPRTRALQTANILNKKIKAPFYILKEFDERQVLSSSEKDFEDEYKKHYLNYSHKTKNFETCKTFIDRVFKGIITSLTMEEEAQTIAIVAHSSTLYALNAFVNGIPEDKQIRWLQCSNGTVIKFYYDLKQLDDKSLKQKQEETKEETKDSKTKSSKDKKTSNQKKEKNNEN